MRVLLFAHPRTGTTFLRSILNTHPKVYFYGEVLYPDYFSWGFSSYLRWNNVDCALSTNLAPHVVPFLNSITGVMEEAGKTTIGFDLKIPQVDLITNFHGQLYGKEFAVIHLVRRNPLESIVSQEIMHARNRIGRPAHITSSENAPPMVRAKIDIYTLKSRLTRYMVGDEEIEAHHSAGNYLKLFYEDLCGPELVQNLEEIGRFLSLDPTFFGKPQYSKENPWSLESKIENYSAVCDTLSNTPYSKFLGK